MELDGKRQRSALTAAERTIKALAAGDRRAAYQAALRAADLDQIGTFAGLPDAVAAAPEVIDDDGWATVRSSLPPGPLHALIDEARGNRRG